MIESVHIQNFKSIRDVTLPLRPLNVLIGTNGVGKTNFISFFELLKSIFQQRLGAYTMDHGGIDRLYTKVVKFLIIFLVLLTLRILMGLSSWLDQNSLVLAIYHILVIISIKITKITKHTIVGVKSYGIRMSMNHL